LAKISPHDKENHVILSGAKVGVMLRAGEIPPIEFTRPEVPKVLIDSVKAA
jgi:sulfate adenylyltransferase